MAKIFIYFSAIITLLSGCVSGELAHYFQVLQLTPIDTYKVENQESLSGIGDYYSRYEIKLSAPDTYRIIRDIQSKSNFRSGDWSFDPSDLYNRYHGSPEIRNYKFKGRYHRQVVIPNGEGYAPTYVTLEIDSVSQVAVIEEIDE